MSANPIERVALDAIEFIEDLTANPLLDSEDVEMDLEDVQAHAGIEAVSLRKRLRAALEAESSEGERRGLERAAAEADAIYRDWIAMRDEGRMSKLTAQTYADMAFYIAGRIRALIPEAPVREAE